MSTWSDLKNNPRLKKIYDARIEIVKLIREFFWSRGFVETESPIAVRYPGQEPHLNPAPVAFHNPQGHEFEFYLHTSPEFAMKKLLAAGYSKIFQITKCFRDYENFGGTHNTEFAMIEWYRSPGNYLEIMEDAESLLKHVGERLVSIDCHSRESGNLGCSMGDLDPRLRGDDKGHVMYRGRKINIMETWERKSMKDLWKERVGVDLDRYLLLEDMKILAKKKGYSAGQEEAYEDVFYKIFLNEIEPNLGMERPIFVYEYPAQMTSLCRLCEHDPRYAERFELYIGGLELANAFGELTDADEQLKRLEEDKAKRASLGKPTWPVDPDFMGALRSGLAPSGGVALGVDRMVLLFTGARDLDEVIFQSVRDQLKR